MAHFRLYHHILNSVMHCFLFGLELSWAHRQLKLPEALPLFIHLYIFLGQINMLSKQLAYKEVTLGGAFDNLVANVSGV